MGARLEKVTGGRKSTFDRDTQLAVCQRGILGGHYTKGQNLRHLLSAYHNTDNYLEQRGKATRSLIEYFIGLCVHNRETIQRRQGNLLTKTNKSG